jgi:hypothetical protein
LWRGSGRLLDAHDRVEQAGAGERVLHLRDCIDLHAAAGANHPAAVSRQDAKDQDGD